MKRIVHCLVKQLFMPVVCTAAVLGAASVAPAEGDAQLGPTFVAVPAPEAGLSVNVAGVGMNPTRSGTITIDINGPVRAAYLYWNGGGAESAIATAQELDLAGTNYIGTQIGVEHEIEDALAYRAVVTSQIQTAFTGSGVGTYNFNVSDPTPADNLDRMHGAALVVIYVDQSDPNVYGVSMFDGADYAFRLFVGANAVTVPVTFNYLAEPAGRVAKLALIVGEAKPIRPDRYTISNGLGTQTINNELASTDGPEFDTVLRDVTIPSGDTSTTVQLFSPAEFTNSDSLLWIVGALQLPLGPPTGACCFPDGDCQVIGQTDCTNSGGTYMGDGIACTPTLCRAKCCLPDGSCILVPPDDCTAQGGTAFSFFEDCSIPTNCPVPTGGCCLPSGACASLTEDDCTAAGGNLWMNGIDCTQVECPGACCFTDGSCQFISLIDCTNAGGIYRGDGVTCGAANCDLPMGACCLPDGSCDVRTEADCNAASGQYFGDGTDCTGVRCEGACCLPNGTCLDNQTTTECAAAGGTYQGLGSTCATANCPDGACCLPDGSCQNNTTQPQCEVTLGGVWRGLNTDCGTVQCLGACCLVDGSCSQQTKADCDTAQGFWFGPDSLCGNVRCEGACCMQDGSCQAGFTVGECAAAGGSFMGVNSQCGLVRCTGACCLQDGSCLSQLTLSECTQQSGVWQGLNSSCGAVQCLGACCLPDGGCDDNRTADDCVNNLGGVFQGLGSVCANIRCEGACCLGDGTCVENATLQECFQLLGIFQGLGSDCSPNPCPQPTGACCLFDGTCVEAISEQACNAQGGTYQGDDVLCANVVCPVPPPGGGCSPKGSLVIFSKVEIRWDANGNLIQDTFLQLTNDFPSSVRVKFYFVNGDAPLAAADDERPHPGWNWANNTIVLTADQPTYWSAVTGLGGNGPQDPTFSPFTVLDPGFPPGRPDPESNTGERHLRGFILAWAIDINSNEIRWNHLAGNATLVHYRDGYAWEYPACAKQVNTAAAAHGQPTGTPGVLNLNGFEYASCYDLLLMNFQAVGSIAFSGPRLLQNRTDVTLHPLDTDLRQETDGPVTTKAHYLVWNMNEAGLSGAFRCITCWDQSLLSSYGIPNHFMILTLQTDHGKARIDGIASQLCDQDLWGPGGPGTPPDGILDVVSQPTALMGLRAHLVRVDGGADALAAGTNMFGMGTQNAVIQYDLVGPPPELKDIQTAEELFDALESLGYDLDR